MRSFIRLLKAAGFLCCLVFTLLLFPKYPLLGPEDIPSASVTEIAAAKEAGNTTASTASGTVSPTEDIAAAPYNEYFVLEPEGEYFLAENAAGGGVGVMFPRSNEEKDNEESFSPPSTEPQLLESASGVFTYYCQGDPRWGGSPYGSKDRISSHGCGPTALAMLVSSFSSTALTPDQAAVWAYENGHCSPGQGSLHSIIPAGCDAFGLLAESLPASEETIVKELSSGHILVSLVKNGYFSNTSGHFLILLKMTEDGRIKLADPGNPENNQKEWDPAFIASQLKSRANNGGPLWSVQTRP